MFTLHLRTLLFALLARAFTNVLYNFFAFIKAEFLVCNQHLEIYMTKINYSAATLEETIAVN